LIGEACQSPAVIYAGIPIDFNAQLIQQHYFALRAGVELWINTTDARELIDVAVRTDEVVWIPDPQKNER
jgi:hypothetical protein